VHDISPEPERAEELLPTLPKARRQRLKDPSELLAELFAEEPEPA